MSKVKIVGNASGSGTLTFTGPDTNSDRTITLPDETGTVALGVGIDDNADATAITIDSSENVGIGNTSPSSYFSQDLVIDCGNTGGITIAATATSDVNYLCFADGTTGNEQYRGYLAYSHTSDSLILATAGSTRMTIDSSGDVEVSTGNLVIGTAGKGIDFSAQTATSTSGASTTSELLDHYEEGTWTPTWTGATSSNTTYTRIGRVVYASGFLTATGGGTSGDCGGLPYSSAIDGADGGIAVHIGGETETWQVLKILGAGFRFYKGGNQQQQSGSNGLRFNLTYHV